MLAAYLPGFFKIHLRYIRNFPLVWATLFVAPFIAIKLVLVTIFGWFGEQGSGGLAFDIMAIFLIAICFFLAERHRNVRQIYVYLGPAIIAGGLLYWAWSSQGFMSPGFMILVLLIAVLVRRVYRISTIDGWRAFEDGGSRKYRKARKLFSEGQEEKAMKLMEKTAKKGHFKSLYFLAESYELGRFYERDLFKACALYLKSSKKGYKPAHEKFRLLFENMSEAEQKNLEGDLLSQWLD